MSGNTPPSQRCQYLHCRKFIFLDMGTGMCTDCAKGAVNGLKKYFKKRSIVGVCFTLTILLVIPAINVLLGLHDAIHIPIRIGYLWQGYMSIALWDFGMVAALGLFGIIWVMVICYLLAFTRKINFDAGLLQYKVDYSVKGDEIFYASAAQIQKGRSDSATRGGLIVIELLFSIFTGPFYFIHGLYTLRKLSTYINTNNSN